MGEDYKVQEAIKGLYMEGKKLSMAINNVFSDVDKEIEIVCQSNDINNLEKDSLSRMLGYIKNARRDVVIDITVIDNKYNYIYGYNFKRQELSNKEEIKIALAGKVGISDVQFTSYVPSYEIAKPIFDDKGDVKAVILVEISVEPLNDILKEAKLMDESTEAYIVNKDGVFITESRFDPDAVGKTKIDLKKIKLSIDYSKDVTYKDYRGIDVYGTYFDIPGNNWTMIFERDASKTKMDNTTLVKIGQYFALIQAIAITVFQKVFPQIDGIRDGVEVINKLIDDKSIGNDKDK